MSSSSQRFFFPVGKEKHRRTNVVLLRAPPRRTPMRASSRSQPSSRFLSFFLGRHRMMMMMMMMMMMRGWKLYVRFWVDEYEANNEEREHCGVFHVKDTHISIHTYTSFEKTLRASLLCDYVRKRTQKRQRFCFPLTKATRRQNRSLSLCLFVSLFLCLRIRG